MSLEKYDATANAFRQAVDGQPEVIQQAILTGFLVGESNNEAELRYGLVNQLAGALGALTTHEHFLAKTNDEEASAPDGTKEDKSGEIESNRNVITWATQLYNQFIELPQVYKKTHKNAERRDLGFITEQLRQASSEDSQPKPILHQSTLVSQALETWQALAIESGEARGEYFVDLVEDYLCDRAESKWYRFPKEAIAGYVQRIAHGSSVSSHLESILAAYFDGPDRLDDKLISYINFALSARYLLGDQRSIDFMTEVAGFKSDILSPDNDLYDEILSINMELVDVQKFRLKRDAWKLWRGLRNISSYSEDDISIQRSSPEEIRQRDLNVMMAAMDRLRDHEGYTTLEANRIIEDRAQIIEDLHINHIYDGNPNEVVGAVRAKYGDNAAEWFIEVQYGISAYEEEYLASFGYRARALGMKEIFNKAEHYGHYETVDIVSAPIGDMMFDVYLPDGLDIDEDDFTQICSLALDLFYKNVEGSDETVEIEEIALIERPVHGSVAVDYHGHTVFVGYRKSCEMDGMHEHELNELSWYGIPDIEGEEFSSAQLIAERIKQNHRWYVDQRGFEVRFKSPEMRDLRLEKIEFKRLPNSQTIEALLTQNRQAGNKVYRYRINGDWQLDLEGKSINSPRLQSVIERRTLAILEYYSTREAIETSKGTITEKGVSPGVSHVPPRLVFLGLGKGFSSGKYNEYLEAEGKDLLVESQKRQISDPQGRKSTYRKAYDVEPDGSPVEVYVKDPRVI